MNVPQHGPLDKTCSIWEGKILSPVRVKTLQTYSRPLSRWQLRGLLGLTGYCRQWMPHFSATVTLHY